MRSAHVRWARCVQVAGKLAVLSLSLGAFLLPSTTSIAQSASEKMARPTNRDGPSRRAAPNDSGARRIAPRDRSSRQIVPRGATRRMPGEGVPKHAAPRDATRRVIRAPGIRTPPHREVGRTNIRGRNFSVWREGHRVRIGRRWRTLGGLSARGVIVIGSSTYYPYAYSAVPESYCYGLTEDGCSPRWQEVLTLEGDVAELCVMYCPWD
jgi:hypothetical protein